MVIQKKKEKREWRREVGIIKETRTTGREIGLVGNTRPILFGIYLLLQNNRATIKQHPGDKTMTRPSELKTRITADFSD